MVNELDILLGFMQTHLYCDECPLNNPSDESVTKCGDGPNWCTKLEHVVRTNAPSHLVNED